MAEIHSISIHTLYPYIDMNEKIKRKFEKEKFLASLRPVIIRSIAEKRGKDRSSRSPSLPHWVYILESLTKETKGETACAIYSLSKKRKESKNTKIDEIWVCVCGRRFGGWWRTYDPQRFILHTSKCNLIWNSGSKVLVFYPLFHFLFLCVCLFVVVF